jgi:hypothetical protein
MVAVKVAGRWFVKSEVEICVYCESDYANYIRASNVWF